MRHLIIAMNITLFVYLVYSYVFLYFVLMLPLKPGVFPIINVLVSSDERLTLRMPTNYNVITTN